MKFTHIGIALLALNATYAAANPAVHITCLQGEIASSPPPIGDPLALTYDRDKIKNLLKQEAQNYSTCLDLWTGLKIENLVDVWGAPDKITKMPNTDIIFVWRHGGSDKYCRTSIFTRNSKIKKWQWDGNTCRRASPP